MAARPEIRADTIQVVFIGCDVKINMCDAFDGKLILLTRGNSKDFFKKKSNV
jgi:hypothetical protein